MMMGIDQQIGLGMCSVHIVPLLVVDPQPKGNRIE